MAAADAARLDELGDKRQRLGLTEAELQEAAALVERHDRVLIMRAEAAALLDRHGQDVTGLLNGA